MLEKEIERRMVQMVKQRGGLCYKFVSPSNPGVPDRIIIMTGLNKEFIDFITDEKANAEGFEMLAKDYQRMKDVAANGKRS